MLDASQLLANDTDVDSETLRACEFIRRTPDLRLSLASETCSNWRLGGISSQALRVTKVGDSGREWEGSDRGSHNAAFGMWLGGS